MGRGRKEEDLVVIKGTMDQKKIPKLEKLYTAAI